ncbi:MAG: hypothetical protein CO137_01845 [Candidatus Magasanikbacteria bacterium CG_4_9_14_3_um_filter_32_9]|uniref:Uncharacterized protein n=1 Tax=Candidatus Magasanikbacteria bacterium CG_4_9_14_3_um_filter_32_9 TaxID=1974644 RepID=A0A2M7Z6Y5_9BACT|nr:MAG: hypothetical protein CO137_01845 [Candidatus Magasanikbacteria bacterium CG_4_9_14_3_um_filter_32_9]
MSSLFVVLCSILGLFFLILLIKKLTSWQVCTICASVSITWTVLLFFFWNGIILDPLIIGILMGQSVIGIYYVLEKKLEEKWHVFRLPFILSATLIIVISLGEIDGWLSSMLLVLSIWLIFLFLYIMRNKPKVKKVVENILACCKNW